MRLWWSRETVKEVQLKENLVLRLGSKDRSPVKSFRDPKLKGKYGK